MAFEIPAGKTSPGGPACEYPPFAVAVELAVQLLIPITPRKNGFQLLLDDTLTPTVPKGILFAAIDPTKPFGVPFDLM